MPEPRKLHVFLCHASQDKPVVRELYQKLLAEGWIDPWLDEEKLLPGQDWELEIEKAVDASDAVIVCFSSSSVTKEGFVQKEIKKVLDISDQKPEGTIFIIPLRLNECQPPRRLAKWQYVDYFPARQRGLTYQRLLQSLTIRRPKVSIDESQSVSSKKQEIRRFIAPQNRSDHHSALISEQVSQAAVSGITFVLVKLQWGKDDLGYSLHAGPNSFSSAGMQTTDFLAYLGFKRESCSFLPLRECYATWADSKFELSKFAEKFGEAFNLFEKAARQLESCAHILDQPEGWGYFNQRPSSGKSYRKRLGYSADGHKGSKTELLKQSEDSNFVYRMSWIESANEKGWVFHYRLKDGANPNLLSALRFLRLAQFKECPYFDFEECYWIYIQNESRGDSFFDNNANIVHSGFAAHEKNFSPALQMLIEANDLVLPFGFHFLNS